MSLELMKERIKNTGITPKQSKINDAHRLLCYDFQRDTAYADSVYFWIPGAEPMKGSHVDIKLYDKKYNSAAGITVAFQTQIIDIIEIGDYLYDESENIYWICTESFNVEGIHFQGKLTQCNWHLRWQRKDRRILEYPCQSINSTQYNSGISGNNIILGSAQHMVTVQATEDTLKLSYQQRFYLSRTNTVPYIVTQNDTTSYNYGKGLCKITLTQDQNSSDKDRPDLGICDYHSPTAPPTPSEPDETTDLSVTISGGDTLKCGRAKSWTAAFKNKPKDYKWNIVSDFAIPHAVNGEKIQLKADNEQLIGCSFLLQILVENLVASEIRISIVGGL